MWPTTGLQNYGAADHGQLEDRGQPADRAGNRCKQATGKPQPGNCSLLPQTRTFLAIPDLSVGREYIVLTPKLPGNLPLAQQGYALLKGWSYRCQISVDPKTQQLRPQA